MSTPIASAPLINSAGRGILEDLDLIGGLRTVSTKTALASLHCCAGVLTL